MARSQISNKIDPTQPVFVGLDVHKAKWSVCIIHQDEVLENHTIPGDYNALKPIIEKYKTCRVFSAYEAGFLGFYLHRYLEKDGINNIVVASSKIPTETGNYVKTDRRDAKKIAFSLSKKLISGINIPTIEQEDFRQLLRAREKIVRTRRSLINRIKMLLLRHEIKMNQKGITKENIEEMKNYDLPENTKLTLEFHIEHLEFVTKQINTLSSRAHKIIGQSKYGGTYRIINTIPGVGPITAGLLCFEIGDFSRFSSGKKLAAFLGITPREYSSGEHVYKGRITGQGNNTIRYCIIESCWLLISKDPAMKEYYNRIKRNTGSGKKAIVAVGRKLVNRIHSIVVNNQCYSNGVIA